MGRLEGCISNPLEHGLEIPSGKAALAMIKRLFFNHQEPKSAKQHLKIHWARHHWYVKLGASLCIPVSTWKSQTFKCLQLVKCSSDTKSTVAVSGVIASEDLKDFLPVALQEIGILSRDQVGC